MRFVLALVVALALAGVASADMPRGVFGGRAPSFPGGWCAGCAAAVGVTAGGLWLARRMRRR